MFSFVFVCLCVETGEFVSPIDKPFITCKNVFSFTAAIESCMEPATIDTKVNFSITQELAVSAGTLLNSLKSPDLESFASGFSMEFKPAGSGSDWELSLRLNTSEWFDYLMRTNLGSNTNTSTTTNLISSGGSLSRPGPTEQAVNCPFVHRFGCGKATSGISTFDE